MLDQELWREDIPRLARGALGRQDRGHWNTTVANAWGVLAVQAFAKQFEEQAVTGVTRAALSGTQKQLDWARQGQGAEMLFAWPPAAGAAQHPAWRNRQTVGDDPVAGCRPAHAAVLIGLSHRAHRDTGRAEERRSVEKGDVLRVRLDMEAQSDMSWVVVNDPVPAGATMLGTGLGRRFADPERRRNQAAARCGPRSRSASSIPFAPTIVSCRRASGPSSTPQG